ncbi:hypothetical protein [Agromyces sp. LHK192]|uniref:hypothetical protein n=1 Tax=Agromyces sp. LHK192 TaxID=2498704 RepID=UPI000FD73DA6|nr:hypothetical protein [Agromyces sp. LHK192]
MATHLEYVNGPLGELSVLPCGCARGRDHARPTSFLGADAPHTHRSVAPRRVTARRILPTRTRGRHAA